MNEFIKIPDFVMYNGNVCLYRAVSSDELYSIMQLNQFTLSPMNTGNVKYFGVDLNETVAFANISNLIDLVAVFEIGILLETLLTIGDFTHVDTFIFKKGTVIIQKENLKYFNKAIKYIKRCFWGGKSNVKSKSRNSIYTTQ